MLVDYDKLDDKQMFKKLFESIVNFLCRLFEFNSRDENISICEDLELNLVLLDGFTRYQMMPQVDWTKLVHSRHVRNAANNR